MARRKRHEEHVNHEAWAIPYGDLLTLLLAFFVVMYAISSLNEGKYRVLAEVLNAEFRGKPTNISPVQVGDQHLGPSAEQNISVIDKPLAHTDTDQPAPIQQDELDPEQSDAAKQTLDRVANDVEAAMSNLIHDNLVKIRRHDLWVEVELQTDFLFPSGSAALSPLAVGVLEPLADSLRPFKNMIRVEGHTDNVPIKTQEYKSNWELSAARAASVVRVFSLHGVDPARLTVIGHAEYRPVASNNTLEGRNANRRVVLVILNQDQASKTVSDTAKAGR